MAAPLVASVLTCQFINTVVAVTIQADILSWLLVSQCHSDIAASIKVGRHVCQLAYKLLECVFGLASY